MRMSEGTYLTYSSKSTLPYRLERPCQDRQAIMSGVGKVPRSGTRKVYAGGPISAGQPSVLYTFAETACTQVIFHFRHHPPSLEYFERAIDIQNCHHSTPLVNWRRPTKRRQLLEPFDPPTTIELVITRLTAATQTSCLGLARKESDSAVVRGRC